MSERNGVAPCPFCGGDCDPTGWLSGDGVRGPECESCGATAASVEDWNRRFERDQLRAEVEALRPVAREFAGFFSSDNPRHWELHALADGSAITAKEA